MPPNTQLRRRLKLFYAAGPGDVIGTFRYWREGREDASQVARTYSGQFYNVVREFGAQALVISSHTSGERLYDGDFRIEHLPPPFRGRGGLLYHFGRLWSSLRLLLKARAFGADVMVVSGDSGHWFPLRLAPLMGIKVIPSLHCVLWRKGTWPTRAQRIIGWLDRYAFTRTAAGILSASHDITEQLTMWASGSQRYIYEFLPTYDRGQFSALPPPEVPPFRVFYAGRIERNKGVFDLLDIAKRFAQEGRTDIAFDLAGAGTALAELRSLVEQAGSIVSETFNCHGHCNKNRMRELFARAHVVIVPTTSDFVEGFNQVIAEGVLSGRPVITSSVCPALKYVRAAAAEVPPDDVQAYGDAILQLCNDSIMYNAKRTGCIAVQEQFYDPRRGWAAALSAVLYELGFHQAEPTFNSVVNRD